MECIEDYVTIEQARKLKEVGFPQDYVDLYTNNEEPTIPTIYHAQKWLRNNKGIYIFPIFAKPNWSEYTIDKRFSFGYSFDGTFLIEDKSCYTSYEEALSAGIDKTLNYLKHLNKYGKGNKDNNTRGL